MTKTANMDFWLPCAHVYTHVHTKHETQVFDSKGISLNISETSLPIKINK